MFFNDIFNDFVFQKIKLIFVMIFIFVIDTNVVHSTFINKHNYIYLHTTFLHNITYITNIYILMRDDWYLQKYHPFNITISVKKYLQTKTLLYFYIFMMTIYMKLYFSEKQFSSQFRHNFLCIDLLMKK